MFFFFFFMFGLCKKQFSSQKKIHSAYLLTNASKKAYAKDLIIKINKLIKESYHIFLEKPIAIYYTPVIMIN